MSTEACQGHSQFCGALVDHFWCLQCKEPFGIEPSDVCNYNAITSLLPQDRVEGLPMRESWVVGGDVGVKNLFVDTDMATLRMIAEQKSQWHVVVLCTPPPPFSLSAFFVVGLLDISGALFAGLSPRNCF